MIKLIVDSMCGLPKKILGKYDIEMASATLDINGESYNDIDYDTTSLDKFYERLKTMENSPLNYPPQKNVYASLIEKAVLNGYNDLIIMTPSSHISSAYELAVQAKEIFLKSCNIEHIKIHVCDTLCFSVGYGYIALKTAMKIKEGMEYKKAIEYCEKYKNRVKHLLSVTDTANLSKITRMSITSTNAAKLVGVLPILAMNKRGIGTVIGTVLGQRDVEQYYVDEFVKLVDEKQTDFVIIGYSSDITYAKELREMLFKRSKFVGDIHIMQVRAVVGSYIGMGGISICFMSKQFGATLVNLFK